MSREKKAQTIDKLQELFSKCSIGILTDYRGLSAPKMTALRRKLRELGIEYTVVKNTLARYAMERAGKADLGSVFRGPVALAVGYGDVAEPAKALLEYISTSKASLSIKGGFLKNSLLSSAEVETLSKLPSREILIGKVLSGMQSPIVALVSCLTNPIRGIIVGLQARIQQLEGK
jgi:large subunit ribosomal protein L10